MEEIRREIQEEVKHMARQKTRTRARERQGTSWADVPPERCFWCRDGRILRNLSELPPALRHMSAETFRHHVNSEKNDFANWIDEIVGEQALAHEVRNLRTKDAIARKVESWL